MKVYTGIAIRINGKLVPQLYVKSPHINVNRRIAELVRP
jgi:hypothetical protein